MVLSDRTIREEIESGRIVVSPLGEGCIQPASVDVHLDDSILVFRNSRRPYIDVRQAQDGDGLTEMVEIDGETPFMLHPGEFVLGSTVENIELPEDLVARLEGKSSLGRIGTADPLDGRIRRPRVERPSNPGAEQRVEPARHALRGHEDRADFLPAPDHTGREPLRVRLTGQQVPGPDRAHPQPHPQGLRRRARPGLTAWATCHTPSSLPGAPRDASVPTRPSGRGAGQGWRDCRHGLHVGSRPRTEPCGGGRAARGRRGGQRRCTLYDPGAMQPPRAHATLHRRHHRGGRGRGPCRHAGPEPERPGWWDGDPG